jgi:hypothetical protein
VIDSLAVNGRPIDAGRPRTRDLPCFRDEGANQRRGRVAFGDDEVG